MSHNVKFSSLSYTRWGTRRCTGKQNVSLVRKLCNGDHSRQSFHQPYSLCPPRNSVIFICESLPPLAPCLSPLPHPLPLPTSFPSLPICCPLPPLLSLPVAPLPVSPYPLPPFPVSPSPLPSTLPALTF